MFFARFNRMCSASETLCLTLYFQCSESRGVNRQVFAGIWGAVPLRDWPSGAVAPAAILRLPILVGRVRRTTPTWLRQSRAPRITEGSGCVAGLQFTSGRLAGSSREARMYVKRPAGSGAQFPKNGMGTMELKQAWEMRTILEAEQAKNATVLPEETIVVEGRRYSLHKSFRVLDDCLGLPAPESSSA